MANSSALDEWLTWAFSPAISAILVTLLVSLSLPLLIHWYLYKKAVSKEVPSFILVGPSGSGKTSLLTLFANGTTADTYTSQEPQAALCQLPSNTRSREDRYRSENDTSSRSQPRFHLVDNPGHGKLRHHATTSIMSRTSVRGLIFVVDSAAVSSAAGLHEAAEYLHDILLWLQKRHTQGKTSKGPQSIPVLVAANKQDVFTSLPTQLVKLKLEDEVGKIRESKSKGFLDSGVGMEDDAGKDEEGDWLGEYASKEFRFVQMEEHGVDVKVLGGNVRGDGDEGGKVEEWWGWIGENLTDVAAVEDNDKGNDYSQGGYRFDLHSQATLALANGRIHILPVLDFDCLGALPIDSRDAAFSSLSEIWSATSTSTSRFASISREEGEIEQMGDLQLQELLDVLKAESTDRDDDPPKNLTDKGKGGSPPQPVKHESNGKHPDSKRPSEGACGDLPTSLTEEGKDSSRTEPNEDESIGKQPVSNRSSNDSMSPLDLASPTKTEEEQDLQAYKKTRRGPRRGGHRKGDNDTSVDENPPVSTDSTATPLTPATNTIKKKKKKKTNPCRYFKKGGTCPWGDRCRFIHEEEPVVANRCRWFQKDGACPWGDRCRFIHEEGPARARSGRTPSAQLRGEAPGFLPPPKIARTPEKKEME